MSAQPTTAPTAAPVETHEEWARRVIAEHGPPPQPLRDRYAALMKRASQRSRTGP